jgi:ergothioneine biosynthesis protein EgtB
MTVVDDSRHNGSAAAPLASPLPQEPMAEPYQLVRQLTERLAEPLSPEDQTVQSMADVSPTKWHRAHTTWFFETFLLHGRDGYRSFDPSYGYLFNSYYEGVGPRHSRPERGFLSRPGCGEIARYRAHVDEAMFGLLDAALDAPTAGLVELGLHHEQQHQELLLMDIKHVLGINPTSPVYAHVPICADVTAQTADLPGCAGWIEHEGGMVEVGHSGQGFAFDNEGPRHEVRLEPFALADRLVTCGEWLDFIEDGGYRRPELWLSDGWGAIHSQCWDSPLYWRRRDGEWLVFTLGGERAIRPAEPVCHVSYYEADAFARWADARLPTEFEWEAVADTRGGGFDGTPRFLDLNLLHPAPQDAAGLLGDTWVWTSSAYLPYPRFRPAAGAVGEYNGKFMVNQHVLRGGSCVTPQGHIRPSYRNFFPPSARWAFSGVRLARDPEPS